MVPQTASYLCRRVGNSISTFLGILSSALTELELTRIQERFLTLETAAEGCCNGALRAAKLAAKIEPATFSDPDLRKRAEGLSKTAHQLRGFEETLRTQIAAIQEPVKSLESFGLQRG